MKYSLRTLSIISFCIAALIVLCLGSYYYVTFRKENVRKETVLYIYHNTSYEGFLDSLENSGAITNMRSFKRAASRRKLALSLQDGRYLLKEGMSNNMIIRTISNNWETPLRFVFRGYVRTPESLANKFGKVFEADSSEFIEALRDTSLMHTFGFKNESYLGMFIPNTYEMYWTTSPADVLKRFKKEYDAFWNEERSAKAKAMNFSKEDVSTLASIVCEETNNEVEMHKIAGVYINRLHKRMPLQACPTIKYAHLDTEPNMTRMLSRHLKVKSPYNTYTHYGLPPGVITIPPVIAIDAVLNYEKTDYLYFCAKPEFDGTHNFSKTYSQHKRYSEAYNKAYIQREREKAKAAKEATVSTL